jgi:hypothetical protein
MTNTFDILCGRISHDALELQDKMRIFNHPFQMTLSEVDLIGAERHIRDALENVQEILAEIRKGRKESA